MRTIKLTPAEIMQGAIAGVMRQTQNISRDRTPRYGATKENDWQLHVEGCLGEMAVAKEYNLFWNANLGVIAPGDIGRKVEVRTRSRHHYDLILHPSDPDGSVFVLLTGTNGSYTLHGWLLGIEGKQQRYWADPAKGRPAFFVPQSALRSPESLRIAAEAARSAA